MPRRGSLLCTLRRVTEHCKPKRRSQHASERGEAAHRRLPLAQAEPQQQAAGPRAAPALAALSHPLKFPRAATDWAHTARLSHRTFETCYPEPAGRHQETAVPLLDRNGFETYYEDVGAGEPLVFICGLGADLQAWRFQVPELVKANRVITFDNRGAGRSGAPDESYNISQLADDLLALLNHLRVPSVHLVGWSMGGVVAQTLALAEPSRVKTLLLLATFAAPDGYLRAAIGNWVNMCRSSMPYEHIARYLARMVYSPALANRPRAYEAFIQAMLTNPYRQSRHGFYRQAEALLCYETPTNLSSMQVPTTVLVGRSDQLTPPYMAEQLQSMVPGARLTVLPGAHSGFAEYPEEWTAAIRDAVAG